MTPTQPPAPTEATASTPITDEPWRILSEWIGSGSDAHAAMAELAEAGYAIVESKDITTARRALIDGAYPDDCECGDCEGFRDLSSRWAVLDPILAARQTEGVRDGE